MIYRTRKEVTDSVTSVICDYNSFPIKGHIEQLYSCKAWILTTDNFDFIILQSYTTIVAAFQRSTGILWVFGFYSNTTAKHISKFRNWVRYKYNTGWAYPKIVRLYNDSRTGKRAARKNLDDDFASVIATALNQQ